MHKRIQIYMSTFALKTLYIESLHEEFRIEPPITVHELHDANGRVRGGTVGEVLAFAIIANRQEAALKQISAGLDDHTAKTSNTLADRVDAPIAERARLIGQELLCSEGETVHATASRFDIELSFLASVGKLDQLRKCLHESFALQGHELIPIATGGVALAAVELAQAA